MSDGLICYAENNSFGHHYCAFRSRVLKRGHGDLCPWCRDAMGRVVEALGHSIAAFCRRQRVADLVETITTSARGMADAADSAGAAYSCGDRLAMRTAAMLSEECAAEHHAALTELAALALAGGSEGT